MSPKIGSRSQIIGQYRLPHRIYRASDFVSFTVVLGPTTLQV